MRCAAVVLLLVLAPTVALAAGPPANVLAGTALVYWRHDGVEDYCSVDVVQTYAVVPDRGWRLLTEYGPARPWPSLPPPGDPLACLGLDMRPYARLDRGNFTTDPDRPWDGDAAYFSYEGRCHATRCHIDTWILGRDLDRESRFHEKIYLNGDPTWSLSLAALHMTRVPVPG